MARLDHRDVVIGRALARAHTRLGGLGRDHLVREDANPDLSATLEVVRDCAPGSFDLSGGDPGRLERADGVLAEGDGVAAQRHAAQTPVRAFVHLAMLHAFWLQHVSVPRWGAALVASAA